MNRSRLHIALLPLIALMLTGCPPDPIPFPRGWTEGYLLTPYKALPGRTIPAAFLGMGYADKPDIRADLTIRIDNLEVASFQTHYGAGYYRLPGFPARSVDSYIESSSGGVVGSQYIEVANFTKRQLGGELTSATDLRWEENEVIELTRSISVPAGSRLTIESGVMVFVGIGQNIDVSGDISISGTRGAPVFFQCSDPAQAWGGIYLDGGRAEISNCLITQGGGDDSRQFGHSQSQAVIGGRNASVIAEYTAIVDNKGKAFGLEGSTIKLEKCLVQRCDTGGEFAGTKVDISGCWFLEMPDTTAIAVDDDNDALYFNGPHSSDTSYVLDSYFVQGKDDAIDHNGALLVVSDCVIDGFDNEGVAASNARYIRIENCYIRNCEQGIEAGYGSPRVEVNHCTVLKCDTGLRFGDWYNWGCSGVLVVANSISIDNRLHNAWNFDVLADSAITGALEISYSIVNDTTYNGGIGCIVGIPAIDEHGRLFTDPPQPGQRAGADDHNMGRLSTWPPN